MNYGEVTGEELISLTEGETGEELISLTEGENVYFGFTCICAVKLWLYICWFQGYTGPTLILISTSMLSILIQQPTFYSPCF